MEVKRKKLSEMLLSGPDDDDDVGLEDELREPSDNEQGREDQLQAFADFTNDALSSTERADALAFFVELVQASGPTLHDDD